MNHLAFILWIVLWPIALSLCGYIDAKTKKITGKKEYSEDTRFMWSIVTIIIWVAVAKSVY
jgi:heme/copper-type cytochrome/quinol oxidase subunit 2